MEPYKVIEEPFKLEYYEKDYEHVYGNPFKHERWVELHGELTFENIMNFIVRVADTNVLHVSESYAYAYAMAQFGHDFFNKDIFIRYVYQTEEAYKEYGVANISWHYKDEEI